MALIENDRKKAPNRSLECVAIANVDTDYNTKSGVNASRQRGGGNAAALQ